MRFTGIALFAALLLIATPAWALDAVDGSVRPTPTPTVAPKSGAVLLKVSNLPWAYSHDDLTFAFGQYGTVITARIATDRETGRSAGFGFVEMPAEDAQRATEALQGAEWAGRRILIQDVSRRPEDSRFRR